ncbi:MAG: TVP38/TMEM64 family protein [Jaaginema sp. PMC 1079.18]|nr:TVP38/TMEM64 family protein [Jaaginema sp. PMC 1080.18]MEC4850517.1 TVP38/TMEM64 family protein [Jaaginema sp. PMC 1079.18]MEC4864774.1 TVP38/TMEM64 family protein [Jaaginema sp. PMC 1078.18]
MKLKAVFKQPKAWLIVALFFCLIVCLFSPLRIVFDVDFLTQNLCKLGGWAIFGFIGAYIVLTAIALPGTVLTIVGGTVFGLFWGTVWSVIGATLGAIAAFLLARYLLYDWYGCKFKHSDTLRRFHQAVKRMPFKFVLTVRFAPISPFNVVNFLFGLTPIDLKIYSLGTFLGIIPGTLLYTWLGVTGREALSGGDRVSFFLALGFLALFSVLPWIAPQRST